MNDPHSDLPKNSYINLCLADGLEIPGGLARVDLIPYLRLEIIITQNISESQRSLYPPVPVLA